MAEKDTMWQVPLGPCELEFNETNLGETSGGVTLTFSESTQTTTVDRTGETSRSKVVTGTNCTVAGALAEASLNQIQAVTGGEYRGNTQEGLHLRNRTGTDLVQQAKKLILKPIEEGEATTDTSKWIVIPKSSVNPNFQPQFALGTQKIFGFTFEGHVVTETDLASGGMLADEPYFLAGDVLAFGQSGS